MAAILFLLIVLSSSAFGGTFNYIGYGAANQGLGNSTVALPVDGFSQAYNPALMAEQSQSNLSLSIQGAFTSFTPINQVLISTPSLGAAANTVGNVSLSTKDAFVFALGYQTALNPKAERPVHVGINVVTPILRVFEINSPDMFAPQYSMYMSDTQRIVPSLTIGKRISDKISLGIGLNFFLVQGTTSETGLVAGGESTSDLSADITTGAAPMAGILVDLDENWKAGLNYRGVQNYLSQLNVSNQLSIVTPSSLAFTGSTSVAYDPDMILLGFSNTSGQNSFSAEAKYERWSAYSGGAILLTFQTYTGSFSQYVPPTPFHDIITLHGGFEHRYSASQWRVGYSYVPTPVPDQSGETNILDSDKHEFYLGYGWKWDKLSWLDGKVSLDLVAFGDYLVPKKITKVSSLFIGAPGYSIGGTIFGYGATVTRDF